MNDSFKFFPLSINTNYLIIYKLNLPILTQKNPSALAAAAFFCVNLLLDVMA